jgi:prepilin-type N-terminal cleavage/methylation domain-containing protein
MNQRSAFSLIELLAVLAILAAVAAATVALVDDYDGARRAREAHLRLAAVSTAILGDSFQAVRFGYVHDLGLLPAQPADLAAPPLVALDAGGTAAVPGVCTVAHWGVTLGHRGSYVPFLSAAGLPIDPWGRALTIDAGGGARPVWRSAGPDPADAGDDLTLRLAHAATAEAGALAVRLVLDNRAGAGPWPAADLRLKLGVPRWAAMPAAAADDATRLAAALDAYPALPASLADPGWEHYGKEVAVPSGWVAAGALDEALVVRLGGAAAAARAVPLGVWPLVLVADAGSDRGRPVPGCRPVWVSVSPLGVGIDPSSPATSATLVVVVP